MKDLVLVGAGGFGREVAWLVSNINKCCKQWNLLGFVDDYKNPGSYFNGIPILGGTNWLKSYEKEIYVACTIANPQIRAGKINEISVLNNVKFATLIDPSAILSEYVNIGVGSIICAGSIITVNVEIGDHVIINLDCTIGHDASIKSFCTLYPSANVSGNTVLEEYVEMGTGSQIIQGLSIGESTTVGAGAVVVKDLPSHCTAVGIPARPIKFNNTNNGV